MDRFAAIISALHLPRWCSYWWGSFSRCNNSEAGPGCKMDQSLSRGSQVQHCNSIVAPRTLATLTHFPVKHKLPFRLPSSTSPQLPSFDAIQIKFLKLYLHCQALDTTQHMTHKQSKLWTWHELLTGRGEEILLKLWEFGNYVFSLSRFRSLNISKVCFSFRQLSRSRIECLISLNAMQCSVNFQFWQEVLKHQFNS